MQDFTRLYVRLDETNSTNDKVAALVDYFDSATALDAAWAVFLLSGESLKRPLKLRDLASWAAEYAGVESWVWDASYETVGDMAETIALLVTSRPFRSESPWNASLSEAVGWVDGLRGKDEVAQKVAFLELWEVLPKDQIFVLGKLITGALRVGVSKKLVVKALSQWSGIEQAVISHRLMGRWSPSSESFEALFEEDSSDADVSRPYPFFLAAPLEAELTTLGKIDEWLIEWKWDGIRGQLIRRKGQSFLWSRGEELVTAQFPELDELAKQLPEGTVLDGEIMAWSDGPMTFNDLQRRLGRKRVGKRLLAEVPCRFIAYDILEVDGQDIRSQAQSVRRQVLEEVLDGKLGFGVSELIHEDSWKALLKKREESRERGVEGMMLKRKDAEYGVGRVVGPWWKFKVDPYEIDVVMMYAQAGHGRRASLHTDYTFGVWEGDELVPVAKAYSGLNDKEIRELDKWIRSNTLEKFGPVRSVPPIQVFELKFENAAESKRHKSGVALRFPRIGRWRQDKKAEEAATLDDLKRLAMGADDAEPS